MLKQIHAVMWVIARYKVRFAEHLEGVEKRKNRYGEQGGQQIWKRDAPKDGPRTRAVDSGRLINRRRNPRQSGQP